MSEHGNSKQNDKSQHLYGIYERGTNALFKYGISAGAIGKDGMSKRMRIPPRLVFPRRAGVFSPGALV